MKFTCNAKDIAAAVSTASKVVNAHTTVPILNNVLVAAKSGRVSVRATDLELTLENSISAEVQEEGSCTVPARLFSGYLANLPAEAGLKTLAATIKARWVCEQAHQQLKEELGLDHFEGRSWRGLHRHALMTMIAYAFLQHHRLAAASERKKRPGASGGKKSPSRPAAANAASHTKSRRRRPRPSSALSMPTLPPTNPQTAQLKVPK